MGPGPGANNLEGGFHNVPCQHQCPHGRMSSPNGCHQCLCPQGELQWPSASPGSSPRSAGGSDPGSFQITASALGPGVCEIFCVPFNDGVSISYSPLTLPEVSPSCLQSQTFWGLSSWCRTTRIGSLMWGLRPLTPWVEPVQL